LKANRYIAQNNEDALYSLVSEYESYLSQSVKYGIFDKWFYYKYVLLSLTKITEGFVLVEEDFIAMLDNPEVQRSPTKMFNLYTKLWWWSSNGEKKENYFNKIQNLLQSNEDLKNSIFFAHLTRESLMHYFENVANNVTSNNIYVINKSDITQSKKVLKRRKLENTVDMDMLISLETLYEYSHQKNLGTLKKFILLYEKAINKSFIGFGENKWALIFYVNNQLGEWKEYDIANSLLIKENKGWEKIWDDHSECLFNTLANDLIKSELGMNFNLEYLKASVIMIANGLIADNMKEKKDWPGYEKYTLKHLDGLKIIESKKRIAETAMDLSQFYFERFNNEDGEKYLNESDKMLSQLINEEYISTGIRYSQMLLDWVSIYNPNFYRRMDNVLTKVETLLIDKEDYRSEYESKMLRAMALTHLNMGSKERNQNVQYADSLLNNYDFFRDWDYDAVLFEYYKDNKQYDKIWAIIIEKYDLYIQAKNYFGAFNNSINNYYSFVVIPRGNDSDFRRLDSLITNVEKFDTSDDVKLFFKARKLYFSTHKLASLKYDEATLLNDVKENISMKDEILKYDYEKLYRAYIHLGLFQLRTLKSAKQDSIFQELLIMFDQIYWNGPSKNPSWLDVTYLRLINGDLGYFNEELYFKYFDKLSAGPIDETLLEEKFRHVTILWQYRKYDEAIAVLENLIYEAQNIKNIEYELLAYSMLSNYHNLQGRWNLFFKRTTQALSLSRKIENHIITYKLIDRWLERSNPKDPNFIKYAMELYELPLASNEEKGLRHIIKYYEYKSEIDSVIKYINEGISKKSQISKYQYLALLSQIHDTVMNNESVKLFEPIFAMIDGKNSGENYSENIKNIYSELMFLKDYNYDDLDFEAAPFIIYTAWQQSVDLKSVIDGEYLMAWDWYSMIKKLSNIESDETKEWGYANVLWETNKRIKDIEDQPLQDAYKGFGFKYEIRRGGGFYITTVFTGPARNKVLINDQIVVSKNINSQESMDSWIKNKIDQTTNGKAAVIELVRGGNDTISVELIAGDVQPNPFSKNPKKEIGILLELYDLTYKEIASDNLTKTPVFITNYKNYLLYYPLRYWYTNNSYMNSNQNIELLDRYESTSTIKFINKSLMHKNSVDNNPILFKEYKRLSNEINSIQLNLQAEEIKANQVKNLMEKRVLAYNELKYFEDYNLEQSNTIKENFSFNDNLNLFNNYDRIVKYCSAPPAKNLGFIWSKETRDLSTSYTTFEDDLSILIKSFEQILKYDVQNPIKSNDLQEALIEITKTIFGANKIPIFDSKALEGLDVLIATEGNLNFFPYELLQIRLAADTTKYHYYGEFSNITYTPSLSAFTRLNQQKSGKPKSNALLVSANPNTGNAENYMDNLLSVRSNFGNIKYVDSEINNIDKTLSKGKGLKRGIKTTVLDSKNITENKFKSLDLSRFKYIHLAAHGVHDIDNPQYSGILLGREKGDNEDGILQSHEIFPLKLNADLVTLSSCFSGFGEIDETEGIMGIYRTFLIAGAKSVIISLWDVEDESTALLFTKFYEYLKSGNSKAKSLRLAKMYLKNETRFNHPFYWAPFILIGES